MRQKQRYVPDSLLVKYSKHRIDPNKAPRADYTTRDREVPKSNREKESSSVSSDEDDKAQRELDEQMKAFQAKQAEFAAKRQQRKE